MINYYNYPHTNLALPARYGGASHYPHDTFIFLIHEVEFLSNYLTRTIHYLRFCRLLLNLKRRS
jgi:hypothetical protein